MLGEFTFFSYISCIFLRMSAFNGLIYDILVMSYIGYQKNFSKDLDQKCFLF